MIVALSWMGCGLIFLQHSKGFKASIEQSPASTQLIAYTQDSSGEFRETTKVNAVSEVSSETLNCIRESSLLSFELICLAQYNSYLQKQLLQKTSSKLYLHQRSLII